MTTTIGKETSSLKEIVNFLNDNQLGIIPSETIYGLCAKYSPENELKLNLVKGSPNGKPVTCLITNLDQLDLLGIDKNKITDLELFFTGKLTILVKDSGGLLRGIKWTNKSDLQFISSKVGPILLTSVNKSGEKEITDLNKVDSEILEKITFVLAGECGNVASTIVNIETNQIIRQGEIIWKK